MINISDGSAMNSQCGGYEININIEVLFPTNMLVVAADQTICAGDAPDPFTVTIDPTNPNQSYRWQSSNVDCFSGFADIPGANSLTLDPGSLTSNTFYRLIVDAVGCNGCLLYTSPSPRDRTRSRMPSSA